MRSRPHVVINFCVMMAETTRFEFDASSENVVFSSGDSLLRVWESATGRLKHEYLPSSHLSAACTCLRWLATNKTRTTTLKSKKKKKRKSNVVSQDEEEPECVSDIIAIGTSTGGINIYSTTKGDVISQLKGEHATAITDICYETEGETLFSCSQNGLIVHWDTRTAKPIKKWTGSTTGLSSLAMCGSGHLIAAGRSITVWDIEDDYTQVMSFTGHATDVTQLHCIGDDYKTAYILSLARDDRVISVWQYKPSTKRTCKKALASFIMNNEPEHLSVHLSMDSMTLAVLSTASTVEVFEHRLNGQVKRPIKPQSTLKYITHSQQSLPILAVSSIDHMKIQIMYGSFTRPAFECVEVMDDDMVFTRTDPSTSTSVTVATSVGNIRQPKIIDSDVTTLTPAVEGGRRMGSTKESSKKSEKRLASESEPSMEERLALLRGSVDKTGGQESMESFATLLTQGLQSGDSDILNKTLQTSDVKIINNTVRRLPPPCVIPLMKHLTDRLEGYGSSRQHGGTMAHTAIVRWLKALFHRHSSYLSAFPQMVSRVQALYSIMENRVGHMGTYTRLQGRLELMLSQIARQTEDDNDTVASSALLNLQDESSEDEMPYDVDMLGAHSESEDGYLSADDDDMMKI